MKPAEIEEYNQTGHKMIQKAEDKLKGGFLKNLLSSKDERFDSALDYYKKALDNFKLAKNCNFKRERMRACEPRNVQNFPRTQERA